MVLKQLKCKGDCQMLLMLLIVFFGLLIYWCLDKIENKMFKKETYTLKNGSYIEARNGK